ncbi:unnamed protein product [Pleuronectes platessa]|uniref:Uncharacterized protein n=1 Tax=Pleuronectes platessa TaxID=8262 RepID=A0A9N7Y586_PLEPL|nr:unnamed protein product [Pleuronectes platessa]
MRPLHLDEGRCRGFEPLWCFHTEASTRSSTSTARESSSPTAFHAARRLKDKEPGGTGCGARAGAYSLMGIEPPDSTGVRLQLHEDLVQDSRVEDSAPSCTDQVPSCGRGRGCTIDEILL